LATVAELGDYMSPVRVQCGQALSSLSLSLNCDKLIFGRKGWETIGRHDDKN